MSEETSDVIVISDDDEPPQSVHLPKKIIENKAASPEENQKRLFSINQSPLEKSIIPKNKKRSPKKINEKVIQTKLLPKKWPKILPKKSPNCQYVPEISDDHESPQSFQSPKKIIENKASSSGEKQRWLFSINHSPLENSITSKNKKRPPQKTKEKIIQAKKSPKISPNCKTIENTLVPTTSSCSSLKNVDRKADLSGEVQRNFLQDQTSLSTSKSSQKRKKSNTQLSNTASSLENLFKLPPENLQNPSSVLSCKITVPPSSPPNKKKIETEISGKSSSNRRRVQFTPLPEIPHTNWPKISPNCKTIENTLEPTTSSCSLLKNVVRKADLSGEVQGIFLQDQTSLSISKSSQKKKKSNTELSSTASSLENLIKQPPENLQNPSSILSCKITVPPSSPPKKKKIETQIGGKSSSNRRRVQFTPLPEIPHTKRKCRELKNLDCTFLEYWELFKNMEPIRAARHKMATDDFDIRMQRSPEPTAAPIKRRRMTCSDARKTSHPPIKLTIRRSTSTNKYGVDGGDEIETNELPIFPEQSTKPANIPIRSETTVGRDHPVVSVSRNIDKNMTITSSTKCALCNEHIHNSIDLTDHYVVKHKTESYASRLSVSDVERLQNNIILVTPCNNHFIVACVFCKDELEGSFADFYAHYTSHTGEYSFKCEACDIIQPYESDIRSHQLRSSACSKSKIISTKQYPSGQNVIHLYVCKLCNFVQLNETNIKKHQKTQHGFDEDIPKIIKKFAIAALDGENVVSENCEADMNSVDEFPLSAEQDLTSEFPLKTKPSPVHECKGNIEQAVEKKPDFNFIKNETTPDDTNCQSFKSLLELLNAPDHTASPVHECNENIEEAVREKPDFCFVKNETTPEKKPRQSMVYRHTDFNKLYFGAFKCMQKNCWYSSNISESFKIHMASHEQLRKKKYLDCSYCQLKCPNVEKLIRHVMARHAMSCYQCPECAYRSMIPGNVIIHQKFLHPNNSNIECVYECGYNKEKAIKKKEESLHRKMLKNTSNLKCPDCSACYYALSSIKTHIHREHALLFEKFDSLGFSELACIHCSEESNCKETMQTHLALEHPDKPGYVVERKLKKESCEDSIKNLRMIDISLKVLSDNIQIPVFDELEPEPPKIIDLKPNQTTELVDDNTNKSVDTRHAPDCSKISAYQESPEKIIEILPVSSVGNEELVSLESNATVNQSLAEKEKESIEPCIVTDTLNQLTPNLETSARALEIELNQDDSPKKLNEGMSKQSTDSERSSPQAPDDCENESIPDSECLSETASAERLRVQYLLKLLTENTGIADSDLYKCSKCCAPFSNFELWLLHVGKRHKVDKVMPCPYCADQLELENAKHHFEGHRQHKYICFHCIASFSLQEEIIEHFSSCHSKFTSVIQNKLEIENVCFYFVQNSEDNQTDFTETLRQFASAINLHLIEKMQRNMISEWVSGLSPYCLEEVDLPSYLPNGDHKCLLQDCPFIGSDENDFDKHISDHELPGNMTCPDCMAPSQAVTSKDIKNHYVLHRATMLHICGVCKFFHHQRDAITEHIESFHNSRDVPVLSLRRGSPPLKISLSIVVSQNKTNFKECFCCSKQVSDRKQLINHLRKQHRITMCPKCELCDKVLITVKEVELHSKEHDEQNFKLKYEVMIPCLYKLVVLTRSPLTLKLEVDATSPKRAKLDDVPIIEESVVKTDVEESSNGNCNDIQVGSLKCLNVDQLIQANQSEQIPISEPIAIDLRISKPSQVDVQCYGVSDVAAQRTNIPNFPQTNTSQNITCHQVLETRADLRPVLPPFEASFSTSTQSSTYTHSNCPQTLTNHSQTTMQITNLSMTTPASVTNYQTSSYTTGLPIARVVPLPKQTTPQEPQAVSYTTGQPMELVVPLPAQTTPQQPQPVSYTTGQPIERMVPLPTQTTPQGPQAVSYTAGQPMELVVPLPSQPTPQQLQAESYTAGQPMERMVPLPTQTTPEQPQTVSCLSFAHRSTIYEFYNPNIPEIAPICAYCDLECSDFYKLKMHYESNHAKKNERFLFGVKRKVACNYCSFTGVWDSFKLHYQRVHPGDKVLCQSVLDPTRCGLCNQIFRIEIPSKSSSKLHTMVPCGCPDIVRTLADCLVPQILKSLKNIGLPAYIYPCKLCTESFVNQEALSQHIAYVHNRNDILPQLCEVKMISRCFLRGCSKSTESLPGMIWHIWLSHRSGLCNMGTFENRWKSCYSYIQIVFPLGFVVCIGDLKHVNSKLKTDIRIIEEKYHISNRY